MKKSLILVSALIVLAVLVGCNADQIAGFGKGLEKIGDLGLGQRRTEPMNHAVEAVNKYIEESEKLITWPENMDINPDYGTRDAIKLNDSEAFMKLIDSTVDTLLAAKDSSARSKELRSALDAKYEGKGKDAVEADTDYHILYYGLREQGFVGGFIKIVEDTAADPRGNLGFIAKMLGMTITTVEKIPETLKGIRLPFVLQAFDWDILLNEVVVKELQSIKEVMDTESSESDPTKSQAIIDVVKQFQRDILDKVGERETATVGDKISSGIVLCTLSTVSKINDAYRQSSIYEELPAKHKYDGFLEFAVKDPKGTAHFDKIMNYLDAISYIYDVKLDITGIVKGMI